ncbi:MAG: HAD family phosphatase [Sphaerochaeta sp.]|nr:HAD family phosphatase [Sphaerochaeta sp.]
MEKKYPEIRAVAFDYGGVLSYFIDKKSIREMADVAHVDCNTFESGMWKFRQELDSGECDTICYWTAVLDYCNSEVPRQSIIETLVEMDLKGFSRMNQSMICWADTLKKHGFGTAIISNMSEPTYQALIVHQPWMRHFDVIVISGIIGSNKPDHRIFKYAIERMHLDAAEILFLDDLSHNVAGAQSAGMHSLQFSTTHTLSEELQAYYPNLPVEGLN